VEHSWRKFSWCSEWLRFDYIFVGWWWLWWVWWWKAADFSSL